MLNRLYEKFDAISDELGVSKDPMGGTGGWCAELHRGRVRGYGDNVLVIWLTLAAR